MGDFLRKNASTPYSNSFSAAGVCVEVVTNSTEILRAAAETFDQACPIQKPAVLMRLWDDGSCADEPRWPRPHLRGIDDLVYAGFDRGSFALIDLRSLTIIGRFSQSLASDVHYWGRVIFPMFMSVIGASVGILELHCACVEKNGRGMLLCGPTQSGKSTLSLALASLGFGFVSDDRTLCSWAQGRPLAWSTPTDVKLRRSSVEWFQRLDLISNADRTVCNGDLRLDPKALGLLRSKMCEPCNLIFLEQQSSPTFQLKTISHVDVTKRLMNDLMAESPEAADRQRTNISRLAKLPASILQYGGSPHEVAKKLATWFNRLSHGTSNRCEIASSEGGLARDLRTRRHQRNQEHDESSTPTLTRSDPLRRFIPRPYSTMVSVMGKSVLIDSNCARTLQCVDDIFCMYPAAAEVIPQFHWSIISQRETGPASALRRIAFSHPGFRIAQFNERSFFAIHTDSRRGFAFITEEMMEAKHSLASPFLDCMFCTCAAPLGFLPLFASCVSFNGRGILIMGKPQSGKTTASYLASKAGFCLHADEGVFLEPGENQLRAWSGFWPVMFRSDALQVFPELKSKVRSFQYNDLSFFHLDKQTFQSNSGVPLCPVACAFLDRATAVHTQVKEISQADRYRRLSNGLLFEEEDRFRSQQEAILKEAAKLPAYQITYGPDPKTASTVICEILARHSN